MVERLSTWLVLTVCADLFDNMYDLVDSLTFKLRAISPNLWPVFELTYNLFKSDAVDFLEGESCELNIYA